MRFGRTKAGLAALVLPRAALATPSSGDCCTALANSGLGADKVYKPDSQVYDERMNSYWSASAALLPWCLAMPTTPEDLSAIIKTLVAENCTFGIRGGGHGYGYLTNSVEEGVTIDFGNMSSVSYDPDTKLATVGPGGHWQDVYDALAPHGVTVSGGRAGTVGVAGFITGGGNSFHSGSHGFSTDNVANFHVVLADGTITNANSTHNADLWQAMKGSSGNLAFVTAFDLYAIDFPDPANPVIWGGNLLYDLDAGPAVVDALVDFTDNVQNDQNSSAIVYWAYLPALGGMLLNAAMENTVGTTKPAAFDGFYAAGNITADTTAVEKMSTVTAQLGSGQPAGYRNIWFALSFRNDARVLNHAVDRFYALNRQFDVLLGAGSGFNTLCMFQPLNTVLAEHAAARGGNVMGLSEYLEADGNGILFLLTLSVNGADKEAAAFPLMQQYVAEVEAYARTLGAAWDWKFLNYAHLTQDAISTFGDESIAKIRAASDKYDPNGVFQTLRTSGFKIPKASKEEEEEILERRGGVLRNELR